jgi:tetraacyldisaccharide 4'-kinase
VSVGNIVVGGSGKTPFSRWLIDELIRRGEKPALLHGGYGADEPELHHRWHPGIPVIAGQDRVAGAKRAEAEGATVVVLDDGFQHRRLGRDLDIVLVPAETWSERPRLLPAGPWREPPSALSRAGAIVVTRKALELDGAAWVVEGIRRRFPDRLIALAHVRPTSWTREGRPAPAPERAAVAVSGVARADLFEANARSLEAELTGVLRFPDHHIYTAEDGSRILAVAAGRAIVTTAKDALKLGAILPPETMWVLEQSVGIEVGAEQLEAALDSVVGRDADQRGRAPAR